MAEPQKSSNLFADVAVRLAAAWILVGGLFKLLYGTPADLPPSTRLLDDLVFQYQVYIAIELALAALAFTRPKLAWLPIVGAFAVFDVVLAQQLAAGAESCGCFGSKVTIDPKVMMAIDTGLLLLVLASRPWKHSGRGAPWIATGVLTLVGAVIPFVYSREVTEPGPAPSDVSGPDETTGGGGTPKGAGTGSGSKGEPKPKGGGLGRGFVSLDIEDWEGDFIGDTPLAKWIEGGVDALPLDGLWVLWRATCDHCAKHLEHLTMNPPDVPFITLVQLKEPQDTEANRVVFVMPEGGNVMHATCPDTVDYILTTPGEVWLEAGIVKKAVEGAEVE